MTTTQNWTADAVCARVDGDAWFPEKGETNTKAKAPCLQWALDHNIQYGVWGGTSRADRQKIQREQEVAA